MKLSQWAKLHSLTYRSAFSHYKKGLIKGAYSLETGTIIVPDVIENIDKIKEEYVVTYARVSSSENKSNLIAQSQRLRDYCAAKGWVVKEVIEEIGSGVNDKRPKLNNMLSNNEITKIVIEHKDRLTRFGFEYIKTLFNGEIVIINECDNEKEDLIQDFISVITSFCARVYGQRRSKRKTEKLIQELQNND
jgi:predicted site-specific integrase-resolvase